MAGSNSALHEGTEEIIPTRAEKYAEKNGFMRNQDEKERADGISGLARNKKKFRKTVLPMPSWNRR